MAIKDVSGATATLSTGDLFIIEQDGPQRPKPAQLDVYKVVSVEGYLVHAYLPQRTNAGNPRHLIVVNSTVASLVKISSQFEDDITTERDRVTA